MGRPRKTDGLKPTLVRRGDKIYAYETTSYMENGKKVNVKRYLGVYDPLTNKILPKNENRCADRKKKSSEERAFRIIDDVECGDYGGVYLLDEIQRQIDLGKDLQRSFGSVSKLILTSGIALMIGNPRVYSIGNTLNHTWLRRYYGVESSLDSGSMTALTEQIGHSQANIDTFFSFRMEDCKDVICWDTTTHGSYTDMEGLAQYLSVNKDNEDIEQFKVGLATDFRGVPKLFRIYPGSLNDMQTVHRLLDDMDEFELANVIVTLDRGFLSGKNCKDIIDRDRRFVMPGKAEFKVFKTLLTRFSGSNNKVDMRYDDHIYSVMESELGLMRSETRKASDGSDAYDFTLPGMEGHGKDGMLKAYVCYDTETYNDQMQQHKLMISDLMERAGRIDSDHPVEVFNKLAGKAVKYFEVKADGRKVEVELKNNAETFFRNRAGMFILVTSADVTWSQSMTAYDARRLTEQAYNHSKEEDKRFRTPNKTRLNGRMMIRFISLTLKCEIAARIREANMVSKLDVTTCIESMNTIGARKYGDVSRLTEITKQCRTICEVLHVDVPTGVRENREICDMMALP